MTPDRRKPNRQRAKSYKKEITGLSGRFNRARAKHINSPSLLNSTLQMKEHPGVLFAGQICGVEGYVESIATGMLAGMYAAALLAKDAPMAPHRATALPSW